MWSIELEGKRKYVVPHGWGQELKYEYFQDQITEEHLKTVDLKVKKDALIFEDTQDGNEIKKSRLTIRHVFQEIWWAFEICIKNIHLTGKICLEKHRI